MFIFLESEIETYSTRKVSHASKFENQIFDLDILILLMYLSKVSNRNCQWKRLTLSLFKANCKNVLIWDKTIMVKMKDAISCQIL